MRAVRWLAWAAVALCMFIVAQILLVVRLTAPASSNVGSNQRPVSDRHNRGVSPSPREVPSKSPHQGQPLSSPSRWAGHPHPVVECRTTQGSFAVEIRPDWAPRGAERYLQLVESGFFTNNLFYRVPERSHPIAQVTNCPVSDSQCMTVILLRAYQLTRHSFTHSHTRLLTCSHVSTLCNLVLVSV